MQCCQLIWFFLYVDIVVTNNEIVTILKKFRNDKQSFIRWRFHFIDNSVANCRKWDARCTVLTENEIRIVVIEINKYMCTMKCCEP